MRPSSLPSKGGTAGRGQSGRNMGAGVRAARERRLTVPRLDPQYDRRWKLPRYHGWRGRECDLSRRSVTVNTDSGWCQESNPGVRGGAT